MGGLLQYKCGVCCNTNGRHIAIQMGGILTVLPFPQSSWAPKVLQYNLEVYCNTDLKSSHLVVEVGVSEILLIEGV